MRLVLLAAMIGALAGCATPCPPQAGPSTPVTTAYACENSDITFTATFLHNPNQVTIAEPGYPDVTLPAQISGSGFRYGANGVELRGRADEARLARPGGGEFLCHAQTAARQSPN